MQRLAHTMESLKFIRVACSAHLKNSGNRMGVVRRKLRVNPICVAKQFLRTAQIRHIRGALFGEDRIVVQPFDLCALNLGVPIGPFHQADHDFAVKFLGQRIEPINSGGSTFAVCLHNHTKAVPSRQRRIG